MAVISSPLAKSLQGGLVQRVSGSAFGGGRGIGSIGSSGVNSDRSQELLENNQSTLTTISGSLTTISQEIGVLRSGIDNIATKISQESRLEEASARADERYQKRLAERAVRSEGEQRLENKIQAALSAPVQAITNKVNSTFGNVGSAIATLLTGWGLNKLVQLVEAISNKDMEALKKIGFEILTVFGFLVAGNGALSLLKAGLGRVAGLLIKLASRVAGFVVSGLFIKPFQALINAIKNGWKNVRGTRPGGGVRTPGAPAAPTPGPKGGKFGLMSLIGKTITGMSGVMNFLNNEPIDGALAALTFLPGKGWIFKGIRAAAGIAFTLDEVAEAFGGNLTGEKKKELQDQQKKAEGDKKSETTPAETKPVSQPQSSLMGDKKDEKKDGATVEANTASGQIPDMPGAAVPAGFEGTAPASAAPVTPQTPMTPDPSSLSLGAPAPGAGMQGTSSTGEVPAKTESTAAPADIKPAPTQPADVKAESLGPQAKPPTTVIATTPTPAAAPRPSGGAGASTNVPKIRSSNPDNFYALYSQFNYNVVT